MKGIRFTLFLILLLSGWLWAGYLHSHLVETLKNKSPHEVIKVIVHVNENPDLSSFKETDYESKKNYLKEYRRLTQQPVIDSIKKLYPAANIIKRYSVFNGFVVELPKWVIEEIVKIDEIEYIVDDYRIQLITPGDYTHTAYPTGSEEIPWDKKIMNAHKAWEMGIKAKVSL